MERLYKSPLEKVTFKAIDSEGSFEAINNEKMAENYELESV